MNKIQRLTKNIESGFAHYLRHSGYNGKQLAIYLPQILRQWVAIFPWRETFAIDCLTPHEWVEIEKTIVQKYHTKWQAKARATRLAKKKRQTLATDKARQLTLDL